MRTIKELLILLLAELELALKDEGLFRNGLCQTVTALEDDERLESTEYKLLDEYIIANEPFINNLKVWNEDIQIYNYYWTKGEIKPRIKWLKKHIKKNK